MELLTFRRGVHPPHGKYLTENKPIEDLEPKELLVFPMSQHIGAPAECLVKKGDRVLVGQKIGQASGFISANIHSSVSGTVKDVKPVLTAGGTKSLAVIVENDGLYEEIDMPKPKNYKEMTKEEIVELIKEAGVVGMGGATFPTNVKLSPPPDKKIDTIILNGAECEPYLTCDHRLMLEETNMIVEGLKIILHMFPEAKGYIGIEDNKKNAIEAMREATKDIPNIEVKALKTKYPQGAEKQLIYAITKREVPSGKLPADAGCIVQNVNTVREVYNAVVNGRPTISRVVTVTGEAVKEPKNLRIRLGMSYRELVEACGGFKEDPVKIISGGPMMGMAVSTLDIPTTKGSSGILCLTEKQAVLPEESSCIRCGKCVQACPMFLIPSTLDSLGRRKEYDAFEEEHGLDCIECGSCTFVCPAKRHLIQSIRTSKRTVLANKRKK
ncbi:electron transport complex subunit RsxC [Clostridium thermopalmarium]|uniref:Ion-translocating oxidoreductase complex subunit C n=1 Tax=Clostridium thermopalmarium DSM 5974 TaxID=1121340 RepID=A0A2T0AZ40_9CLOT|nr:electron transport complex subunit RsxC [Clostridium thermopalmarium]PRR76466.1 Electron transport complex protein RnfC [Clostridium thermopalmarium DSM 5974]PVZ28421.1 electron transport complex protein RnfC [Clostridium thermopalmarium DSM 5974]